MEEFPCSWVNPIAQGAQISVRHFINDNGRVLGVEGRLRGWIGELDIDSEEFNLGEEELGCCSEEPGGSRGIS